VLNFYCPLRLSNSIDKSGYVVNPFEETVNTRDGALAFSVSRSRFVIKNGPRCLVAMTVSTPSSVITGLLKDWSKLAALLIKTCNRSCIALNSAAN